MSAKVCAVPYRRVAGEVEVLAFKHPLAGNQFVKGTLEAGEDPAEGSRRELHEESGLTLTSHPMLLAQRAIGTPSLIWYIYAFETEALPEVWDHWTEDDGGHLFSFFWHPIRVGLGQEWHPIFQEAFNAVRSSLPQKLVAGGVAGRRL